MPGIVRPASIASTAVVLAMLRCEAQDGPARSANHSAVCSPAVRVAVVWAARACVGGRGRKEVSK